MRTILCLFPLALAAVAQDGARELPTDIAAAHPEGKWQIRKAQLYRYLVRYESRSPYAAGVLEDYMKRRLVESHANERKISVTSRDVDEWIRELDAQVRAQSGMTLADLCKQKGMKESELRRKGRQWLLQKGLARAVFNAKDPSRPPDQPVSEESVVLVVDSLYQKADKELDAAELPDGVVARVGGTDITEYEYGRELSYQLPVTEMLKALRALILVEETNLLLGSDKPPTKEELDAQMEWIKTAEKNRLSKRLGQRPDRITDDVLEQALAGRGLSLADIRANPATQAQARAIGHFQRIQTEEDLRRFHEENQARYGARLKVARILVGARAQQVPGVGRKIRTLEQGRALADALWVRVTGGEDFFKIAKENSEDSDDIRESGGFVPFPIHAATPGYEMTFAHADKLEVGGISKPFFDQGRGYVIVKLLEREPAQPFEELKEQVRADLAQQEYGVWRAKVTRAALKNPSLKE